MMKQYWSKTMKPPIIHLVKYFYGTYPNTFCGKVVEKDKAQAYRKYVTCKSCLKADKTHD